ncbi:MAG: hypothetical protein COV47_04180 [Candidatus Diapherotrites archaeon CG11_big_fil_rev_8_21_14_0_20_37_9]|nr:MAG: hypothetical protein COV47_04180 [Candidatus Diapherotrites archaeon CG11_big_fil_rev_8_21_14_0_20_37_9]
MKNITFIILGATGDLANSRIFPAIHRIACSENSPKKIAVIGVARKPMTDESFRDLFGKSTGNPTGKKWKELRSRIYYFQTDFDTDFGFEELGSKISEIERTHSIDSVRLFYLATLPEHFESIARNLKKFCMKKTGRKMVIVEKPFGQNKKTAVEIELEIKKCFAENEIFRADHYLAKPILQKFAFPDKEILKMKKLLNKENVDHVQINILENSGIGKRGNFFDRTGTVRDVGQNHLMQMLSIIAMNPPKNKMDIAQEKTDVLNAVSGIKSENIIFGQYDEYQQENGISLKSKTETFFSAKIFIDNKRWQGVPFFLRAGKHMGGKLVSIYVKFKQSKKNLPDSIIIQVHPKSGIFTIQRNKENGASNTAKIHGPETGIEEEYEFLIKEAISGSKKIFLNMEEIEKSWKIIDKIREKKSVVFTYKKGSFGPEKALTLIENTGRNWFNKIL